MAWACFDYWCWCWAWIFWLLSVWAYSSFRSSRACVFYFPAHHPLRAGVSPCAGPPLTLHGGTNEGRPVPSRPGPGLHAVFGWSACIEALWHTVRACLAEVQLTPPRAVFSAHLGPDRFGKGSLQQPVFPRLRSGVVFFFRTGLAPPRHVRTCDRSPLNSSPLHT